MARSSRPRNHGPRASLRRLARDARGATAVEYGLIIALVALTAVGSIIAVAGTTTGMWNNINAEVTKSR